MNTFSNNRINILDLPDEMLHAIFNKLNMVDMFYSLVDVNQRFNQIVLDSLSIHHLDLVVKPFDTDNLLLHNQILERICKRVIPRINEQVTKLTVDSYCMEHVFNTNVHYHQLHSLSLVSIQPRILYRHLTDNTIFADLFKNQITYLSVDIRFKNRASDSNGLYIFLEILSIGKCLSDLTFIPELFAGCPINFQLNCRYRHLRSSALTKLTINVKTFDDCLFLLDGCLESLSTLIIYVNKIIRSSLNIDNTKKLHKLKCFSLKSNWYTFCYENDVVPFLRRMLNLEELTLFLSAIRFDSTYINGTDLYDEVLNYMPRLNKFTFSIHTHIINNRIKIELPSNDNIRNSFIQRGCQQVDTCADETLINNRGNCHIYSLPYQFDTFMYMGSCFQGGRFNKVRMLTMFDRRPFEHKLFEIISHDLPFLETLYICNLQPQNDKQHSTIVITFNCLVKIFLSTAHTDYVVQFLSSKNTLLPCLTHLEITYEALVTATNDFTNDETRLNCAKIKSLIIDEAFVRPENFHSYFPSL